MNYFDRDQQATAKPDHNHVAISLLVNEVCMTREMWIVDW